MFPRFSRTRTVPKVRETVWLYISQMDDVRSNEACHFCQFLGRNAQASLTPVEEYQPWDYLKNAISGRGEKKMRMRSAFMLGIVLLFGTAALAEDYAKVEEIGRASCRERVR